nr:immunoglobulin light chain junction region [Macaca mulatta]
CQQYNTLPFTC